MAQRNKILAAVLSAFPGLLIGLTVLLSTALAGATEINNPQLTKRLFAAVTANNLASVRSSITAGADITVVNKNGLTAAGLAIEKGYFNIAHYILGVRNQKVSDDDEATSGTIPELPKNLPPATAPTPPQIAPKQAVNQWPADKANPFAPDSNSGAIPIVGKLQKPTVQPALPAQAVTSRIKEQNPANAPLRTSRQPAPRQTLAPTPIKPLIKDVAKGRGDVSPQIEDKGALDEMVDGIKNAFKSEETPKPGTADTKPSNSEITKSGHQTDTAEEQDGVIDRVWQSITNIF